MLSRKKKQTVTPLPTTSEKCHHTTNVSNVKLLHLTAGNVVFLQMLMTLKRASCGLALVALKMTDQRNKN